MLKRRLGRTNFNVSEIGYGMWGLAGWKGVEKPEIDEALGRGIELGCNFFDTAWAYADGASEQILGKLMRQYAGKQFHFATKRSFKFIRSY